MAPPSQPLPADDVFRDRSLLPLPAGYRKLGPTLEEETGQAHRVRESLVAISPVQQKQNLRGVWPKCGASSRRLAQMMGRLGTILRGYGPFRQFLFRPFL